jgi:hypothetical protein
VNNFLGCEEEVKSLNEEEIYDNNARIIPFFWIDSVILGMQYEQAVKIYGISNCQIDWDGVHASGHGFKYLDGQYTGLTVLFNDSKSGIPVYSISVESPYSGKTKEGIGIGSSLNFVRSVFGPPDKINANIPTDVYIKKGRTFNLTYKDSIVKTIGIVDDTF